MLIILNQFHVITYSKKAILTLSHKRKSSQNQNNIHWENYNKKIIYENNRDNCNKQSFDIFKMTCYSCNKRKHLKNKCKNLIVNQKAKKTQILRHNCKLQLCRKIQCHKNIQIFLKFVNIYQQFIKKFNRIIANLNDFLKNNKKINLFSTLYILRKLKQCLKNSNDYLRKF